MMRRAFSTVRGATISPWAQAPSLAQVMNPAGRKIEAAGAECETINLSLDEASGVATVELNRPDKANAANMRMWWELQHAFRAIDTDERCRAALLVGAGKFFCSGMDLSVFAQMDAAMTAEPCEARAREGLARLIDFLQDACSAAERCRVPVIAAIDGPCIGGGLDIATACDLRLCSERAVFSVKEVDLAIVADLGVLQRLPTLVGDQRARELAYTARMVPGAEAQQIGLVLECVEGDGAALLARATALAEDIASKSPLAVRGVKQTMLHARDSASVAEGLHMVKDLNCSMLFSEDLTAAMGAAMAKKHPSYRST